MQFGEFSKIFFPKIERPELFGNLPGNSYIPLLFLIVTPIFSLVLKKEIGKHQRVQKYDDHDCFQNFLSI